MGVAQEFDTLIKDKFVAEYDSQFYDRNFYEYEVCNARAVVKGRLKAHIRCWQDIGAPQWVLDTIRHGYVIPFKLLPTNVLLDNIRSAYRNSDLVSEAISE